jgi:hypothetical protein
LKASSNARRTSTILFAIAIVVSATDLVIARFFLRLLYYLDLEQRNPSCDERIIQADALTALQLYHFSTCVSFVDLARPLSILSHSS